MTLAIHPTPHGTYWVVLRATGHKLAVFRSREAAEAYCGAFVVARRRRVA